MARKKRQPVTRQAEMRELKPLPVRAWMEGAAALIRAVDQPAFPPLVTAFLRRICPMQDCVVTAYARSVRPVVIYYELDPDQVDLSVTQYEKGAYRLDPFYHACTGGEPPGVYRLLDLAPDDFRRSTYYRDYYNLMRPFDEIGLLVRPDSEVSIMFSVSLPQQSAGRRDRQIDQLRAAFPLLAAAIERHWGAEAAARLRQGGTGRGRPSNARSANARASRQSQDEGFGAAALSSREAEVVDLVLRGHSSQAISFRLGIAEATVKIHRKNAYAKLGVASQAELFAQYLDFALAQKG